MAHDLFLNFLRNIDGYLQEFTLGFSEQNVERPDLTEQGYCELDKYKLGKGSAPVESCCAHLKSRLWILIDVFSS